jgi:hypothetical protein
MQTARPRLSPAVAGLTAVTLLFTAMGGAASAAEGHLMAAAKAHAQKAVNACALITAAEASAALGVTVSQLGAGGSECNYSSGVSALTLLVTTQPNAADVAYYKKQLKSRANGFTPVKGIGDVAAENINTTAGEIRILKGNQLMDLTVRKGDPSNPSGTVMIAPATLHSLARTALRRL